MKDLLLLILLIFAFTFVISAVFSILAFFIDVCKWHLMEKKIVVKASRESEVKNDERDNGSSDRGADSSDGSSSGSCDGDCDRDSGSSSDIGSESRECDSRSIFDTWLQSGSRSSE